MKTFEIGGQINPDLELDMDVLIEISQLDQAAECDFGAPFIFFQDHVGICRIVQGCCNKWTCARCGQIRARTEYGKIVGGATILAERGLMLYFHTWTCRGREMPLEEAENGYGSWTNAMLNSCRDRTKSQAAAWFYAQVTERQTRQHPHSHLIMAFLPDDAVLQTILKRDASGVLQPREVYTSDWYEKRLKAANLGSEYQITEIRNPIAVAVYTAKYLFKDAVFTEWPPKWKRIRYSQSWPKNPAHIKPEIAWPLVKQADWVRVQMLSRPVHCDSDMTRGAAKRHGLTHVAKT